MWLGLISVSDDHISSCVYTLQNFVIFNQTKYHCEKKVLYLGRFAAVYHTRILQSYISYVGKVLMKGD